MDGNSVETESNSFNWNTDDELEIATSSPMYVPGRQLNYVCSGESSTACSSTSRVIKHFRGMGFPEQLVIKAVQENGENNVEAILEAVLTYSTAEHIPQEQQQQHNCSDPCSSGSENTFLEDFWDYDSCPESEENSNESPGMDATLSLLVEMGYCPEEAAAAIDRCGLETPIEELVQFISAAQMAKEADTEYGEMESLKCYSHKKLIVENLPKDRKRKRFVSNQRNYNDGYETLHLPNPMVGFGVPDEPMRVIKRTIPEEAVGPPFFYYENVAIAPRGVWDTITRFLYEIQPEFVDSKFFSAAARKRGYIHNLPIQNRFPLLPIPPRTIHEALPRTRKWWPSWDKRTQFTCILSCVGSAKLTERIKKEIEKWDKEPPEDVKKFVLRQCKKWNLIWLGMNKVAPLEPDEIEVLMGFPCHHTRGGGISRTERYKVLANAFQVDTVGYHLSVLKNMFPNGMNVLSLFSGIGGAEVALHRLGIRLKNVVSVETSKSCHDILRSWWEQTKQNGNLIQVSEVQEVYADQVEMWIESFGGFDLVIGGSPCNNLSGANRATRDGIGGKHSALFFEYNRILEVVRLIMKNRKY